MGAALDPQGGRRWQPRSREAAAVVGLSGGGGGARLEEGGVGFDVHRRVVEVDMGKMRNIDVMRG